MIVLHPVPGKFGSGKYPSSALDCAVMRPEGITFAVPFDVNCVCVAGS